MSLAKTMQLSLQDNSLNLQLSFYGKLNKILDEIFTIKINDWEGIIVSFPKNKWEDLRTLNEANYSGIYFLWTKKNDLAYIGQASNEKLKQRLKEHYEEKDWWDRCIFVTNTTNTLDAADLNYLESTFIKKAKEVEINLDNGDKGINSGNISESKKETLNIFINKFLSILEVLEVTGINIFLNKHKTETINKHRKWSKKISVEKFSLTNRGCQVTIVWQEARKVIVKRGSLLANNYQESNLRDKLESDTREYSRNGFIENKKLVKDISDFKSPNEAAKFCCRGSINAWISLKNEEGKSLDEVCKDIYSKGI
jgi:hypothetical protein